MIGFASGRTDSLPVGEIVPIPTLPLLVLRNVLPVTVKLVNEPTLVIFGCALVVTVLAVVALPAVATDKLATCVVLATTNGAVPVATLDIN